MKARVAGFTGVIPYPHSHSLHGEDLRNFECRFDHGIEYPEEVLHYATYTYDAVVIMALAALAAGSTDPSRYVHEVANVTRGGTQCANYAECRELLTDGDPSNDDIDYEGFSGPIELDPDTGNVTDAFFASTPTTTREAGKEISWRSETGRSSKTPTTADNLPTGRFGNVRRVTRAGEPKAVRPTFRSPRGEIHSLRAEARQ